jgi:hypothetical protein
VVMKQTSLGGNNSENLLDELFSILQPRYDLLKSKIRRTLKVAFHNRRSLVSITLAFLKVGFFFFFVFYSYADLVSCVIFNREYNHYIEVKSHTRSQRFDLSGESDGPSCQIVTVRHSGSATVDVLIGPSKLWPESQQERGNYVKYNYANMSAELLIDMEVLGRMKAALGLNTETNTKHVDDDMCAFIAAATGFMDTMRGKKSPPPSDIRGCTSSLLFEKKKTS